MAARPREAAGKDGRRLGSKQPWRGDEGRSSGSGRSSESHRTTPSGQGWLGPGLRSRVPPAPGFAFGLLLPLDLKLCSYNGSAPAVVPLSQEDSVLAPAVGSGCLGDASPITAPLEDAHILSEDPLEPFESLARGREAAVAPGSRGRARAGQLPAGGAGRLPPLLSPPPPGSAGPSPAGDGDGGGRW